MDRKHTSRLSSLGEARKSAEDYHSQPGGQDDQTSSTKSATQSMATPSLLSHTTTRRLNELEAMFRSQQTTLTETTQMGKQMDAALQQTIHTLQENSDKLVLTMERQQDTHVQLVELSTRVSRLTEVMDKMASQLDALTNLTISQRVHGSNHASDLDPTGASRRRPIGELSMAGQSVDGPPATSDLHPVSPPEGPPAPGGIANHPTSDNLASPTKKKARPIPADKPGCTLHTDLEEMSLGSDNNGNTESPGRPARLSLLFHPPESNQTMGGLLLDDSSDDFSTNIDVMPGLDTQYTSPSDPEGGASR
ncbi:hypothetical protein MHU86_14543 [Fragilaria crotonensis]|nr:hypothetical protein MHU86_14543 [Fragilaria crotonensis]